MKIYKHTGKGHYIGSCVIVVANSKEEASIVIRKFLDEAGLVDEELEVIEVPFVNGTLIYGNDGDY